MPVYIRVIPMDKLVIQGEKDKQFVIDLNDSLQLRYELVRELKLSGSPKEEICTKYGYSRVMGHLYETALDKNRWEGLKDKKKDPRESPKEQRNWKIRYWLFDSSILRRTCMK